MTQTVFGPGVAYVTRTDVANSTPVNIGNANEFNLDIKANLKELYGQYEYPLDVARGTAKVTAKAKAAVFSGLAMNTVFFGDSFTTGGLIWNYGEAHSVPASTPYTVTVTNSATFDADLGVIYGATGLPLQKVASGPTVGQYSVAAGVYTFAAADASAAILITYTSTTTSGQTLNVANHLLGYNPTFQLDYYTSRTFQGVAKPLVVRLYNCIGAGISIPFKLEDFSMPEFDLQIFANAANSIGKIVYPEIN